MNRFHKALGFTIFVSIAAPAVAMWNEEGFGQKPFGGVGKVVESEQVLTDYEVQLADRRKKLRKPDVESSGAPAELSELLADTNAKLLDSSLLEKSSGAFSSTTGSSTLSIIWFFSKSVDESLTIGSTCSGRLLTTTGRLVD